MSAIDHLLLREDDPDRPSVENRVAYQWERPMDTLAYRHSTIRDRTILTWMAGAITSMGPPATAVDLGCAYGNHLLMLNAFLGHDDRVALLGYDLYEESLEYGRRFAESVPGYSNCKFQSADITATLPLDSQSVAALNCADVIEHLHDPLGFLSEIRRVLVPMGTLVISTPLRDSSFKSLARKLDTLTNGRLYRRYYGGKDTLLDDHGRPIMDTHAGHDHVSEMTLPEITRLLQRSGFHVMDVKLMPVMSGSAWFDEHPLLLAALMVIEGVHDVLRRPSWAHAVCIRAIATTTP